MKTYTVVLLPPGWAESQDTYVGAAKASNAFTAAEEVQMAASEAAPDCVSLPADFRVVVVLVGDFTGEVIHMYDFTGEVIHRGGER